MPDLDIAALDADLLRDEGKRLDLYWDTEGFATIGIGHLCIDDEAERFAAGITEEQCATLYQHDRDYAIYQLDEKAAWWRGLAADAQLALANQCFNVGWKRLQGFVKMLAALDGGDYATAAMEALDSKWATQVPERAARIAALYRGCV